MATHQEIKYYTSIQQIQRLCDNVVRRKYLNGQ